MIFDTRDDVTPTHARSALRVGTQFYNAALSSLRSGTRSCNPVTKNRIFGTLARIAVLIRKASSKRFTLFSAVQERCSKTRYILEHCFVTLFQSTLRSLSADLKHYL